MINFSFTVGKTINEQTGFFQNAENSMMADFHFFEVNEGDAIDFNADGFSYKLLFYNDNIDDKWIYTYFYQEEESWASYDKNSSLNSWLNKSEKIKSPGWVRVAVRKNDGTEITPAEKTFVENNVVIKRQAVAYKPKKYFADEIEKTVDTVNDLRSEDTIVFGLMTDSHYVINGGWEDTVYNINTVAKKSAFDAMIHLGDYTDGMTPIAITKEYFQKMHNDLKQLGCKLFFVLGNHDSNYFKQNPESMNVTEQSGFYLENDKPYYYKDFTSHKLRVLFLYSFDHTQEGQNNRYGFPQEEVDWVQDVLNQTPSDYKVLICSHVPLLAEMHFWSEKIRNESEMVQVLENYNGSSSGRDRKILGYIHGHSHADQIYKGLSFPIIAIGCNKCEDFKDKKPEGSVTYDRKMHTLTQDLWDVLLVNTKTARLDFVRFGAGEDRAV